VCVVTKGKPLYIGHARAERLVQDGAAEWLDKRKIRFITDPQRRGVSPFPEFFEIVGDATRGVNVGQGAPRMDEDKHGFLHAMKRLSA